MKNEGRADTALKKERPTDRKRAIRKERKEYAGDGEWNQ